MFKVMENLPDHVIGIEVSEKVTAADYDEVLTPLITDRLSRHDRLDFICVFTDDWDGFESSAIWKDLQTGLGNFSAWGRLAVVSDSDWIENSVNFMGFMWPGHLRHFDDDELDQAKDWVSNTDRARVKVTVDELDNFLVIEPSAGRGLSEDDFILITRTVDRHLETHESIKGILIKSKKFPGWQGIGAMASHMKFVRDHHRDIGRIALVTDSPLGSFADKMGDHFVSAQIRSFDYDDHDDAVDWLRGV